MKRGHRGNDVTARLRWTKTNSSSRNPSVSAALCHLNWSTYRLTGPAGIRPQQTERLDWCGCGQEVSLSLSLSLPNSLSMLHSTLWNALARPASPTHRCCCCCGVRGSVVPLQQGPCKRLSPGEPQNDASHAVLFLNPSLIWFISLWQGCVLTELLVSCHPESWASLNWACAFLIQGLKYIMSFRFFMCFTNYQLQDIILSSFNALIMNISLCHVGLRTFFSPYFLMWVH